MTPAERQPRQDESRLGSETALVVLRPFVDALDAHIRAVVAEAVAEAVRPELAGEPEPRWMRVTEAAPRYGCSPAALRMRVRRGRVPCRRHGRAMYVPADPIFGADPERNRR